MAEIQTIVALNLGSQRISMAVFEALKNGNLTLIGYESDTIVTDPSVEVSRDAQVQASIKGLLARLKISKASVRYAIPGQSVFTRFVKLPSLQADNIEQLVSFEVQQHVPFPINEVIWDYEMIESSDEKEVVIVAVKADVLNEINDTVKEAGLNTLEVDAAPMALYNAYRSAYKKSDETTLIIDIGAKTSNLLYIEGTSFFTRSVTIGGASITSAIAKEYSISFAEAESHKRANGIVALSSEHAESMDDSVSYLASFIHNALTRLLSEIIRTTNYYRSQQGGSPPNKILLAGGGVNLPYTLEFFQERLGLPVEFFNPLSHVSIDQKINLESVQLEAHMMGELVGLGLRGVAKSTLNIDLVPSEVEISRHEAKRKPFLIAAAILLLLGFSTHAVFQRIALSKAEDRNRTMLETRDHLSPVEAQLRKLLTTEKALTQVADSYVQIESDHALWFDLFRELTSAFTSDVVWITEITPLYNYQPILSKDKKDLVKSVMSPSVKSDFLSNSNKDSSILNPPKKADLPKLADNKQALDYTANALFIKGYWRENPRSQNIVSDLLKRLRENSSLFSFSVKDPKTNKDVILSEEQVIKSIASREVQAGDLAFPFEVVLPLARPIKVK